MSSGFVLCTETELRGMFISNRSRKGNIIGFACLTTENFNRHLKKLLICIPLMIIFFNLLGFIYQYLFTNILQLCLYLKYHFVISPFRHFAISCFKHALTRSAHVTWKNISVHGKLTLSNYGALLGSKLIMQTLLYHYFRIVTLVAWLINNEVSFDIFSENLLLSARFMACKCFSLPLISKRNSYHMVNCQLSFFSHFLRKLTSFLHVSWPLT